MARLRIRIELNRGGVGVPLHKLASVVEQAQRFFHMLAEDIHVDQSQGEWLGFDFDHESLNFTAEFVGPVTSEQVRAFHAAFDGTTSLRRATIAQFAGIAGAIGEDELIGFGLYLKDQAEEPAEWRCLSRRDALRISEEIQLLAGAGEEDQDTRLPAIAHSSSVARIFSERQERGVEPAKWESYVREVEANLDRRISRVEQAIGDQSGLIEDLHAKSSATEDSVRRLLGAVEGFCAQTTRQLEAMSAPALAAPSPVPDSRPAPAPVEPSAQANMPEPFGTSPLWVAPSSKGGQTSRFTLPARRGRQMAAAAAVFVLCIVFLGTWGWQNLGTDRPRSGIAAPVVTANDTGVRSTPSQAAAPVRSAPQVQPTTPVQATAPAQPAAPAAGSSLRLEASELTWVAIRSADGQPILAQVFNPGDQQTLDLPNGARLRVGNAGGLQVYLNGQLIAPLGSHGQVRDVVFRDGSYQISAAVQP